MRGHIVSAYACDSITYIILEILKLYRTKSLYEDDNYLSWLYFFTWYSFFETATWELYLHNFYLLSKFFQVPCFSLLNLQSLLVLFYMCVIYIYLIYIYICNICVWYTYMYIPYMWLYDAYMPYMLWSLTAYKAYGIQWLA